MARSCAAASTSRCEGARVAEREKRYRVPAAASIRRVEYPERIERYLDRAHRFDLGVGAREWQPSGLQEGIAVKRSGAADLRGPTLLRHPRVARSSRSQPSATGTG